jgi:polar amino acid transport system permease protein
LGALGTAQAPKKPAAVNRGAGMSTIEKMINWIPPLLDGARITILLTLAAVSAGLIMSLFLALGKISKNKVLNNLCSAYIFFFRGTPLLMQLYFIYYGLPQISVFLTINDRFLAAFIAFGLNSAAYCAEIIRAAIQSIDKGQFEAARALGMSYPQTMRLIIIPQSIRRLIPPVGNEFIMVLKDASLVSIIALTDITKATRSISSSTGTALVYIPAMILYLIITAIFTFVFHKLEKKYSVYE